jgi:hypothetical protein
LGQIVEVVASRGRGVKRRQGKTMGDQPTQDDDKVSARGTGSRTALLVLAGLLVFAACFAAAARASTAAQKSSVPAESAAAFDLLGYVDREINAQEDVRDVRCWSSVNKLQMFLAEAPITTDGAAERIERHKALIESIWVDASKGVAPTTEIGAEAVKAVISRRFPHQLDAATGARFTLKEPPGSIQLSAQDVKDYGDTIEGWRLIQSWALSHTNASGALTLKPAFGRDALRELKDFLRVYDLAVMRYARHKAMRAQASSIDATAMRAGFDLETAIAH